MSDFESNARPTPRCKANPDMFSLFSLLQTFIRSRLLLQLETTGDTDLSEKDAKSDRVSVGFGFTAAKWNTHTHSVTQAAWALILSNSPFL